MPSILRAEDYFAWRQRIRDKTRGVGFTRRIRRPGSKALVILEWMPKARFPRLRTRLGTNPDGVTLSAVFPIRSPCAFALLYKALLIVLKGAPPNAPLAREGKRIRQRPLKKRLDAILQQFERDSLRYKEEAVVMAEILKRCRTPEGAEDLLQLWKMSRRELLDWFKWRLAPDGRVHWDESRASVLRDRLRKALDWLEDAEAFVDLESFISISLRKRGSCEIKLTSGQVWIDPRIDENPGKILHDLIVKSVAPKI